MLIDIIDVSHEADDQQAENGGKRLHCRLVCMISYLYRSWHRGRKGGGTSYFLSALSLFAHARRTIDVDRFRYFSCL